MAGPRRRPATRTSLSTARRSRSACLAAGLLDEIQIHLVPVLLGDGRRLFEHLGAEHVELEPVAVHQATRSPTCATACVVEPSQSVSSLALEVHSAAYGMVVCRSAGTHGHVTSHQHVVSRRRRCQPARARRCRPPHRHRQLRVGQEVTRSPGCTGQVREAGCRLGRGRPRPDPVHRRQAHPAAGSGHSRPARGLTLTVLFGSVPLGGGHSLTAFGVVERVSYDNGWWNALAMICTAPLGVWGPAVVVLAIAYYLRRRPRPAPSCCCPMSKWNANGNRHRDEGSSSNGIAQASALSSAARAGRFRRWPERWGGPCGEVC